MKRVIQAKLGLMFLSMLAFSAFGQTPAKIEKELVQHLQNLDEWTMKNDRTGEDLSVALEKEQETFRTKMLKYLRIPTTLKYGFKDLAASMNIETSPDGKFRVYSRDTLTGGTMHFYENFFQFQATDGKVYSSGDRLGEGDPGAFVTDVFQISTKKGIAYLVSSTSVLSTSQRVQSLKIFGVQNNKLSDKFKLIKTNSGLTNILSFEYDFFSVVDREERPVRLFTYDSKSKTISFPVVIADDERAYGRVTDKSIVYKFNGNYFVKIKG